MEPFRELGLEIGRAWRARSYDERALPELALAALERAKLHESVKPQDILSWAITTEHPLPPRRMEREFGQPPLMVFAGERFFIEVLFWLEGTTDIHQHGFSGAFTVLSGSSIESQFQFEPRFPVHGTLALGDLRLQSIRLLEHGVCRPIIGGSALIHSVFHLDHPSVSVVVRTYQDVAAQPQFSYLRPHLAYTPSESDPFTTKRIQALNVLLTTELGGVWRHLDLLVQSPNFNVAFRALELCAQAAPDSDQLALCTARARRVHGEKVDLLLRVFEESRRQSAIVKARRETRHPNHRFLLALLLNAPDRAALLQLVKDRFGDDPIERVATWVQELRPSEAHTQQQPSAWSAEQSAELRRLLRGEASESPVRQRLLDDRVFALLAREAGA